MSRRKQARPRLCKRDEYDEEEGSDAQADSENGTEAKKIRLSMEQEQNGGHDVKTEPEPESREQTQPEVFKCEPCGAIFDNLVNFMDHRNNQCQIDPKSTRIGNGTHSRADTPSSVGSQDSNTGSLDSLAGGLDPEQVPSHVGVDDQHPVPCQYCDKAFSKMAHLRIHEQVHADVMPFGCTCCERVFRHKRSLERHMKTHGGEKRFKCGQCEAKFFRSDELRSHERSHLTVPSNETFPCPVCNLDYPTMAALMSHQNAHKPRPSSSAGRYELKCADCNAGFRNDKELSEHECSASDGKKTYQCQHCAAICAGPTALALHTEHAHSMTNGDQSKCPICYKAIGSIEELRAHIKVHEAAFIDLSNEATAGNQTELASMEFGANMLGTGNGLVSMDVLMCPYCLRDDFETLEHLELHMQSVHSVKPTEVYTCNYCNAPYKNLYSLHEHMRAIHQNQPSMGIKYPCSKCGKEFPSIESLQEHKKRMHHYKQSKQTHADAVYPCNLCSMSFISASGLRDHVHSHHVDSPGKQREDHVTRGPKPSPGSKNSKQNSHKSRETTLAVDGPTIINVPEPSHILRHLRAPVKTQFHSPSGTVHHNASPTGNRLTPQSPSTTSPPGDRNERSKEKITCDQCNACFTDVTSYQAHVKLHLDTVLGQFACRECGKVG